jgi:uncharacterized protein YidB (DUF937 family)
MGILDSLLGSMMGGAQGAGQSPLLTAALQIIQQNGGLPGIISKFQQGGYGQQIDSWVGTGGNMPINGNQLQEVLGSGSIGQIAQQLGLSHGDASSGLAQVLPQLIDGMTPKGHVSSDHADILQQALSALTARRA